MNLQADLADAFTARKRHRLAPIRNDDLVPLVIENLQIIGRPRTSDPIGRTVARRAARAAAEIDDDIDLQPVRQADDLAEIRVELRRRRAPGMERIARRVERRDAQAARLDGPEQFATAAWA